MKVTTEEARAKQTEMEAALLELLKAFEVETGCTVVGLKVKRDLDQIWFVDAVVRL